MITSRIAQVGTTSGITLRSTSRSILNHCAPHSSYGVPLQKLILSSVSNSIVRGLRTSSSSKVHPDNLAPEFSDNILPVSHTTFCVMPNVCLLCVCVFFFWQNCNGFFDRYIAFRWFSPDILDRYFGTIFEIILHHLCSPCDGVIHRSYVET